MVDTSDIQRPPKALIEGLSGIGSATAAGELARLGIRDPHIQGPVARTPGKSVVGPALTLQFMPKREDQYAVDEYADPEKQLHRHALYHTQPGDAIVDGCIRDFPKVSEDLEIGLWLKGTTPNFHTQTNIVPFAVNVPIACGDTLVMPGDIIVADDDGATVVPVSLAPELVEKAQTHAEWEVFSRMKLSQGGHLRKYYPLSEEGHAEYEIWKKEQGQ